MFLRIRTHARTYVRIPNRVSRKHPVLVSSVASHPSRMGTSIRACELKQCAACAAATCRDLGATAIALGFFKTMRRLRRGRMPRPTYVPTLQPQPAEQLVQCFCFRSAWSRPASLSIPLFGGNDAWRRRALGDGATGGEVQDARGDWRGLRWNMLRGDHRRDGKTP